jgi:uncharacterized protein (TIGR03083 family)
MITTDITTIAPLSHAEAMQLQAHELDLTLTALSSLGAADWVTVTEECPAWDVRMMYLHVLGACEAGSSMRENLRQIRRARSRRSREGGPLEAALSAVQIDDRIELTPEQLIERLAAVAPKTVAGRRRTPGLMRKHAKLAVDGPVHEKWTLGYLIDTIYLRDLWMHRVDLSRTTNRALELTAEHDGRIVADVVAEWARRHGQAFVLELEGPAGGTFAHEPLSSTTEHLSMDAVEFCRTLAGRSPASGLLSTIVPF